jgi:hypothetical protein
LFGGLVGRLLIRHPARKQTEPPQLITPEPNHADARELEIDAACDYVHAAIAHLIDAAPDRVLVIDRTALRCDFHRRLLIEIGESQVRFSFPDNSGVVQ